MPSRLDISSVSYLSGYLDAKQDVPEISLDMVLKVAGKIKLLSMGVGDQKWRDL